MKAATGRVFLASALLASLLACGTSKEVETPKNKDFTSPRTAWRQAAKSGPKWTRVDVLNQLMANVDLTGKSRAQVLDLLGPPGYADDSTPFDFKMDFYRLSAANTEQYRVDYDAEDKVKRDAIEKDPCKCDFCDRSAPAVPVAVLDKSALMRKPRPQTTPTISAIEKMLGVPGKPSSFDGPAGGQRWINYMETWRIDGPPHQFLIVTGHTPYTAKKDRIADELASEWSTISFAPDCLAE